jgi:hypothetical protein
VSRKENPRAKVNVGRERSHQTGRTRGGKETEEKRETQFGCAGLIMDIKREEASSKNHGKFL